MFVRSNLGTGTELGSNVSKISLTGNQLNELKFRPFNVGQGTEELGSPLVGLGSSLVIPRLRDAAFWLSFSGHTGRASSRNLEPAFFTIPVLVEVDSQQDAGLVQSGNVVNLLGAVRLFDGGVDVGGGASVEGPAREQLGNF